MADPKLAWKTHLEHLALPKRRLRIALPCCGVSACCAAFAESAFEGCNIFDLFNDYEVLLRHMFPGKTLHLGRIGGDLLLKSLESLELPIDGIIAGPPCPPWSGMGKRKGVHDVRADVFTRVLRWTIHFIRSGGLLFVILENVLGTMQNINGCPYFMLRVIGALRSEVPEFLWDVHRVNTEDYMVPHHRERVYLRGLRRSWCGVALPKPLQPFGRVHLDCFIDFSIPNIRRASLSKNLRRNMIVHELRVRCMISRGALEVGRLACFSVDRAAGKTFALNIYVDRVPTLTTKNNFLFLISTDDMDVADQQRKCFRFLAPSERLALQGIPAAHQALLGDGASVRAAGNSFSAPVVGAMLGPMLAEIAQRPDSDLLSWPPPDVFDGHVSASANNFSVPMQVPAAEGKSKRRRRPSDA